MPYYWSKADSRNAFIASLLPASAAISGACAAYADRDIQSFFKSIDPPKWALRSPCAYTVLDLATISPLGYASYLVYKDGGGFDYTDTTVALTLYGANIVSIFGIVAAFKKKSLKWSAILVSVNAATALAGTVAFYSVTEKAGYWVAPYALWSTYYATLAVWIYKHNSTKNIVQLE